MVRVQRPLEARVVVAASGSSRGIGKDGDLPWPILRSDLLHFRELTLNSAVLMGSATYFSLPDNVRPLPKRLNIVLSSRSRTQLQIPDEVLIAGSLNAAEMLLTERALNMVYVIGGESVFKQVMKLPQWSSRVYYTYVDKHFECDKHFPVDMEKRTSGFDLISVSDKHEENGIQFWIKEYVRRDGNKNATIVDMPKEMSQQQEHAEMQYLTLVRRILKEGVEKSDRTGVGTRSIFGAQMRFDLRESFPLLTTKRVFWRGVVEELLWFIKGSTNANELSEKGIHIWDDNGSRQFLDKCGFKDRQEGDLGPVYGFQWRHFGASYVNMNSDYTGQGVDQLQNVIDTINTRPDDRRMIVCAWNASALPEMALPPCHLLAQFYVCNGELSCQMYQRSCDMGLGVPFNIASYALLTCLIASVCNLKAGEFIHVLGDAHIYNNHVEALTQQLQRHPRPFPKLCVRNQQRIEDFTLDDIHLQGYDPHAAISMKMAV